MKNSCLRFAFLSFFILIGNLLQGQSDTIKYVNGTKQAAKIIELRKWFDLKALKIRLAQLLRSILIYRTIYC